MIKTKSYNVLNIKIKKQKIYINFGAKLKNVQNKKRESRNQNENAFYILISKFFVLIINQINIDIYKYDISNDKKLNSNPPYIA